MPKKWIHKRPKQMALRMTQEELDWLRASARAKGLSMEEFVRRRTFGIATGPPALPKERKPEQPPAPVDNPQPTGIPGA